MSAVLKAHPPGNIPPAFVKFAGVKFACRDRDIRLLDSFTDVNMAHPNIFQALLALALTSFLLVRWLFGKVGRRLKEYPPGPPTLPVIGNLHQIPSQKRHLQFGKWAQEYGPIYSLMLGTQVYIVLSADYAIRDLVDKRGSIYASRPDLFIAQHIVSGGLRVLFMVRHRRM